MIGFLLALAASAAAHPLSVAEIQSRKDWALSRCVGKAAGDERFHDDAFKSAAALLEKMHGGIDIVDAMNALAEQYLKRNYSGSVSSRYDMLKCLDMYHSKELDRIARRTR